MACLGRTWGRRLDGAAHNFLKLNIYNSGIFN